MIRMERWGLMGTVITGATMVDERSALFRKA